MYGIQKDGMIRIAVIGEENVGKSSLISTYISTVFPEKVPPILTEAILPPENSESHISISVRDTQINKANNFDSEIQKIIQSSNCIIILYDSSRNDSYNNLLQYWLPAIETNLHTKIPIIAVASKIDLLENYHHNNSNKNEKMKDKKGNNILKKFKFVTNCCSCSAKTKQHIKKVFQIAEQAVLYPIAPIFNYLNHSFTNECKQALLRIFRIFDLDGDGLLSDEELTNFQEICFEESLTEKDIIDLKKLIFDHCAEETIRNECITYLGFEVIMKIFVDKYDTTRAIWEILRKFNYDDALNLQLPEEIKENVPLPTNHTSVLSKDAIDFLVLLALQHSNSRLTTMKAITTTTGTGRSDLVESQPTAITALSLRDIFEGVPVSHPWQHPLSYFQCQDSGYIYLLPGLNDTTSFPPKARRKLSNSQTSGASGQHIVSSTQDPGYLSASTSTSHSWNGSFSIEVWILQWTLLATHSAKLTKELLFYLGYVSRPDTGILTRPTIQISSRYRDFPRVISTSITNSGDGMMVPTIMDIKVGVLGSIGSGKSTLISSLGNVFQDDSYLQHLREDSECCRFVSGYTCSLHSYRKHIVCSEVTLPTLLPEVSLEESLKLLEPYDVLVLLIDCMDTSSVNQILLLEKLLPPKVPRFFAISKVDSLPSVVSVASSSPVTTTTITDIDNKDKDNHHNNADFNFSERFFELVRYQTSHNLPKVIQVSPFTGEGMDELKSIISDVSLYPEKGIHKENRSKSEIWYWCVTVSVVVSVAVAMGLAVRVLIPKVKFQTSYLQLWKLSSKKNQ